MLSSLSSQLSFKLLGTLSLYKNAHAITHKRTYKVKIPLCVYSINFALRIDITVIIIASIKIITPTVVASPIGNVILQAVLNPTGMIGNVDNPINPSNIAVVKV